jgi:actin-related protein 4
MVPPVQYGGDEVSAIVLDIGSYSTKAGYVASLSIRHTFFAYQSQLTVLLNLTSYAGEDCPKAVFPTSYAIIPSSDGTDSRTYSHGNNINLYRPHAIMANPIADGLISDWDALSRTLDHAFRERMRLDHLKDFPLLVTESSWNTKENREKMLEVAFEEWETPAYYSVDKSVMSA